MSNGRLELETDVRADIDDIKKTLELLQEAGADLIELRALGVPPIRGVRYKHIQAGVFDDMEKLAKVAVRLSDHGAKGTYITPQILGREEIEARMRAADEEHGRTPRQLNSVYVSGRGDSTTDKVVTRYSWLLVDCDPVRDPAVCNPGDPKHKPDNYSATEEEKQAALEKAQEIKTWLADQSWPDPVEGDSGNGAHLMYRVDQPVSEKVLFRKCLKALHQRFSDERVKVDVKVWNPGRIWKLYGTAARKKTAPGRPHRLGRLLSRPRTLEVVGTTQLEPLAAQAGGGRKRDLESHAEAERATAWIKSAGGVECWAAKLGLEVDEGGPYELDNGEGQRWVWRDDCPTAPEGDPHTPDGMAIIELANGELRWVCHHTRCAGRTLVDLLNRIDPEWDARYKSRPEIRLIAANLPEIIRQAEETLLGDEPEIFQRGSILVKLVRSADRVIRDIPGRGRVTVPEGTLSAFEVTARNLMVRWMEKAHWMKWSTQAGKWIPVGCPLEIAKAYLEQQEQWRVPSLRSVISAPTLRADGSILQRPGYDAESGVYFDAKGATFPMIPEEPTKDQAIAAAKRFLEPYEEFPFCNDSDRAAAASAALTLLIRGAIRTAPLVGFDAPDARSGKTLLAHVAAMIGLGRMAAAMSASRDEEEMRKRIFSLLLEAQPLILIDNIAWPLGGQTICSALTEPKFGDRKLGISGTRYVPTGGTTWLATGNGLQFLDDLNDRVVPCRIDAEMERPEERTFKRNLLDWIPAHRTELVVAGLTLLRGFIVAGRPSKGVSRWGGFDDWNDLIRGALIWADVGDPCGGRVGLEASDPEREILADILEEIAKTFERGKVFQVKDLCDTANSSEGEDGIGFGPLFEALAVVAGERGGGLNRRKLGRYLLKKKGRVVDGRRIERVEASGSTVTWRVRDVGE